MASEIKVDTVSEKTSGSGVTIDGLLIKDGGISGDVSLIGTTPTFTIGDAGAEDAALVFDGNAQDFYVGLDDSSDSLVMGLGSALGTTPAITINSSQVATLAQRPVFSSGITIADAGQIGSASDADAIAIASNGVVTFSQNPVFPDGGVAVADLDIDGATDIGAAIVDADLFIIDDGAGGTNRKVTASRLKTYAGFDPDASVTINDSGAAADFRVETDSITHMIYTDGGNNLCYIGGADTYGSETLKVQRVTSTANAPIDTVCIDAETSGTAADGVGTSMVFIGSKTGQNQVALGHLGFINADVDGAFGDFTVRCRPNGTMAERFRIASNGDLTGTDTSISSNSDSRLKENISDFTYDLAKFKALKPKTFDWKNPVEHGGKSGQRGFIAQELEATDSYWVDKQLLSQYESADIDGNKVDGYTSDYDLIGADHMAYTAKLGKKDAMYVSVIKQLITRIEALEG